MRPHCCGEPAREETGRRMSVWILAKVVGRLPDGEPIHEYFTGRHGDGGGPSRSPFKTDAMKFHDARSAYECAQTHKTMRDSDEWKAIEWIDGNRIGPARGAQ